MPRGGSGYALVAPCSGGCQLHAKSEQTWNQPTPCCSPRKVSWGGEFSELSSPAAASSPLLGVQALLPYHLTVIS